jgi:hypothetical protein
MEEIRIDWIRVFREHITNHRVLLPEPAQNHAVVLSEVQLRADLRNTQVAKFTMD